MSEGRYVRMVVLLLLLLAFTINARATLAFLLGFFPFTLVRAALWGVIGLIRGCKGFPLLLITERGVWPLALNGR